MHDWPKIHSNQNHFRSDFRLKSYALGEIENYSLGCHTKSLRYYILSVHIHTYKTLNHWMHVPHNAWIDSKKKEKHQTNQQKHMLKLKMENVMSCHITRWFSIALYPIQFWAGFCPHFVSAGECLRPEEIQNLFQ